MKATHVWTVAGTIIIAGALILAIAPRPSVWETWRPATCMPARCFCEAIGVRLVKQPVNAVSGLAFAGVGLLVLFATVSRAARRAPVPLNLLSSRPVYPVLYAAASLLIGFGSIFYHASLTFWGQTADVLGMYLIATFLVLYNSSRLRQLTPTTSALLYVAGNAVLLAGLILVPEARRYVFAALILVVLGLEIAARRKEQVIGQGRQLQIAVVIFATGSLIWLLDITKTVCSPNSWLQGHAIWHLAGAISLWLVFLYHKSTASVTVSVNQDQ